MTPCEAVSNVARLLLEAEMNGNPQMMERLDELACTWIRVAEFLSDHVEAQS